MQTILKVMYPVGVKISEMLFEWKNLAEIFVNYNPFMIGKVGRPDLMTLNCGIDL